MYITSHNICFRSMNSLNFNLKCRYIFVSIKLDNLNHNESTYLKLAKYSETILKCVITINKEEEQKKRKKWEKEKIRNN